MTDAVQAEAQAANRCQCVNCKCTDCGCWSARGRMRKRMRPLFYIEAVVRRGVAER